MIKLWENGSPYFDAEKGEEPTLTPYLIKTDKPCAAVIVCPGGAYSIRAYHEGEPVAQWLNSMGISAYVLNYRVEPYTYEAITADVYRAVRYVRYNAEKNGIDKNKIGVLGFSAGGHLASCAAYLSDRAVLDAADPIDSVSSRADAAVLCYPVVSYVEEYAHVGCAVTLFGDKRTSELDLLYSTEKNIPDNAPPTFVWHTSNDQSVNVINSLRLGEALRNKNINFEMHIYPDGEHGLGLAFDKDRVNEWSEQCGRWFKTIGFIE